jgi:3-hydroxyisobutyrate dehydrogenase-like beta-hydroxyacid dehydrogenase
MKTAFIGMGVMGFPMAGHLKAAGHEVAVYNRSPEKARRWAEKHGGPAFETIAEAVSGAEVVVLCVGNDDDVRDVVAQVLPAMAGGGVIVDHTTTSGDGCVGGAKRSCVRRRARIWRPSRRGERPIDDHGGRRTGGL